VVDADGGLAVPAVLGRRRLRPRYVQAEGATARSCVNDADDQLGRQGPLRPRVLAATALSVLARGEQKQDDYQEYDPDPAEDDARGSQARALCRATTRTLALSWCFL
jgi:hypothetical protein